MTFEELRLVVVVYTTAIFPIIILFSMHLKDQLPRSILKIYLSSFLICALGWELWFTYGIYAGDPVDIRRSEILNQYIPKNINWLMNSLADAGTISLGGILLTGKLMGSDHNMFAVFNHLCFYNYNSLNYLVRKTGFKIVKIDYFGLDIKDYLQMIESKIKKIGRAHV